MLQYTAISIFDVRGRGEETSTARITTSLGPQALRQWSSLAHRKASAEARCLLSRTIVPLKSIEYGVYGDLIIIIIYPKPYST